MDRKGSSIQGRIPVSSAPVLIFRGLLVALLYSFLFLTLFTFIIYLSPLSEGYISYLIMGGALVSILLGSIYVGKRTEEKGWLRGGLTGLLYVGTLLLLCFIFQVNIETDFNIFSKFFLGLIFGSLGGIVGINS